jgi:hypothetical protein
MTASLTTLAQVDTLAADEIDASESRTGRRFRFPSAHSGLLELLDAHREMERELVVHITSWIWAEETAIPAAVAGHGCP